MTTRNRIFRTPPSGRGLPRWQQAVLNANNTLMGRMVLGPVVGNLMWLAREWRLIRAGTPGVLRDWGLNAAGLVPVLGWLVWVGFPVWAYLLAAWIGHGLLKIRTYLEHRAHEQFRARTVVVEDRGPLAYLFLNNNYHVVHHMHPEVPWYRLPALYAQQTATITCAGMTGIAMKAMPRCSAAICCGRKDPVPHPVWPVKKS
jgi:fatty acid desaturase